MQRFALKNGQLVPDANGTWVPHDEASLSADTTERLVHKNMGEYVEGALKQVGAKLKEEVAEVSPMNCPRCHSPRVEVVTHCFNCHFEMSGLPNTVK